MTWFEAAAMGDVSELEKRLRAGQKINATDRQGFSALVLATENGRAGAVEFLLKNKADAKAGGAADYAIDAKRDDILQLLLKLGRLDPSGGLRGVGSYVEKAIQIAALRNGGRGKGKTDITARAQARCLEALVKAGADFGKIKGTEGESPLAHAIAAEDGALLRYLMERGFEEPGAGAGKRAKRMLKNEPVDRETIDRGAVSARRGTLRAWDYDTWDALAVHCGVAGESAALVERLQKSKSVAAVRDVTAAALTGKTATPRGSR